MMRLITAVCGLGAALLAPPLGRAAYAQAVPASMDAGQMTVLSKVDALSTATGSDLHEAAMAVCLAFGSQPEVLPLLLTEAGWTKDEAMSFDFVSTFLPPEGSALSYIEIGSEAGYCSVGSTTLGGEAARGLATALLGAWSGQVTTVTEGEGEESCIKHEARATLPVAGTLYLSVMSDGEEDLSCAASDRDSITTYAFVRD